MKIDFFTIPKTDNFVNGFLLEVYECIYYQNMKSFIIIERNFENTDVCKSIFVTQLRTYNISI